MPGRALLLAALLAAPAAAGAADLAALLSRVRGGASAPERLEAVRALRQAPFRGDRAFAALASAMTEDLSNEVRQEAAASLLDYPGTRTLDSLEAFFNRELGEEARLRVCVALATAPAHAEHPGVASLLAGLLSEDPSPSVRAAAVAGLRAREERGTLGDLRRAAEGDGDKAVREAARAALRDLSRPPKARASRPPKPRSVPYESVKGRDPCLAGNGWCECARPPLQTRPRCVARADCEHSYLNSYQAQGFSCTWNGEEVR